MLICRHCGKECKNKNSLSQHQRLCKSNPNRQLVAGTPEKEQLRIESLRTRKERGTFKNQWNNPDHILDPKTSFKISEANKTRVWTQEMRDRHSKSMKLAVEKYPDSYTSSNRGRTKQIELNGVKFQGKWELDFFIYCIENNIAIQRNTKSFTYEWNGFRKYFPDFYLPKHNLFVEVKGYETDRDIAKWSQFPEKLKVIKRNDILEIRKKVWKGL